MNPQRAPAIYLAGPTAAGKSAVALELALRLNGEIISVDSMQVYRGLDIGTAKPNAAEQAAVRHHLIDVADLSEAFDAARFLELARNAEADIRSRGRLPIYCGGTGLYFKALFEGISAAPPSDPGLRNELEQKPLTELLVELAQSDPLTYQRIDRDNPRRVVRAVEAIRLSGQPFSAQQSDWEPRGAVTKNFFAFSREPEDLRHRIDVRVDRMFADGLVAETQTLLERGLKENRTALQAIGYRQVAEHFDGQRSLGETVALIKTRTWQFSRRQKTWLRNQLNPVWITLAPDARASAVATQIADPVR
jgi:tRNA dimethylallyltransferase